MLGIAGSLLVFTGIWHATEWLMAGRNKDTLRLIPFGIAYLILGYLIVSFRGGTTVLWVALVLTLVGFIGAWLTRKNARIRGWVTWVFIIIDAVIIAAIAMTMFAG